MTSVFLDTNIIIGAGFFRSAYAEGFLKGAKFRGIEVLIPEIVIDEVKGNFASDVTELFNEYKRNHKHLGKFMDMPDLNIILDAKIDEYNNFFDKLLDDHDVIILDYPKTSSKELVVKSYEANKPFKATREGHKDYLIWQTIKECCEKHPDDVDNFFITDNKKDFCKKMQDGTFTLHPDLATSLANIEGVPNVLSSLKDFFDLKLKPFLKTVNPKDIPNIDIEEYVKNTLNTDLLYYTALGFEDLPFGSDVSIVYVEDIPVVNKPELSEVDENDILINTSGTVLVNVSGFIDKMDYYAEDDDSIDVDDSDWNDHVMSASKCIEIPFELAISYSKKDKKITDYTIHLPTELDPHGW